MVPAELEPERLDTIEPLALPTLELDDAFVIQGSRLLHRHRHAQLDRIRRSAHHQLVLAGLDDVLLRRLVPVAQAAGGNLELDRLRVALGEGDALEAAEGLPGLRDRRL